EEAVEFFLRGRIREIPDKNTHGALLYGVTSSRSVTLTANGLAPGEPEERQRDQPASHIEHAVRHGTSTILRVRLVILIEACMDRHEHKGEARPTPVPCSRCPCPKRPQQEARQDGIFGEMRGFAGQEV